MNHFEHAYFCFCCIPFLTVMILIRVVSKHDFSGSALYVCGEIFVEKIRRKKRKTIARTYVHSPWYVARFVSWAHETSADQRHHVDRRTARQAPVTMWSHPWGRVDCVTCVSSRADCKPCPEPSVRRHRTVDIKPANKRPQRSLLYVIHTRSNALVLKHMGGLKGRPIAGCGPARLYPPWNRQMSCCSFGMQSKRGEDSRGQNSKVKIRQGTAHPAFDLISSALKCNKMTYANFTCRTQ